MLMLSQLRMSSCVFHNDRSIGSEIGAAGSTHRDVGFKWVAARSVCRCVRCKAMKLNQDYGDVRLMKDISQHCFIHFHTLLT
jgi:hypothetical protein